MSDYRVPVTITVRRTAFNVIEYTVTHHDPISGDQSRVWHANREATFWGPHTGAPGRQVMGEANTFWREDDVDMLHAFRRGYTIRNITVGG